MDSSRRQRRSSLHADGNDPPIRVGVITGTEFARRLNLRREVAHFVSKLTDADGKQVETSIGLQLLRRVTISQPTEGAAASAESKIRFHAGRDDCFVRKVLFVSQLRTFRPPPSVIHRHPSSVIRHPPSNVRNDLTSNLSPPIASIPPAPRRIRMAFAASALLLAAFALPLYRLARFVIKHDLHSYVLLIPLVSGYLLWTRRAELPRVFVPAWGSSVLMAALGLGGLAGARLLSTQATMTFIPGWRLPSYRSGSRWGLPRWAGDG
jgi:hypothetical protein